MKTNSGNNRADILTIFNGQFTQQLFFASTFSSFHRMPPKNNLRDLCTNEHYLFNKSFNRAYRRKSADMRQAESSLQTRGSENCQSLYVIIINFIYSCRRRESPFLNKNKKETRIIWKVLAERLNVNL